MALSPPPTKQRHIYFSENKTSLVDVPLKKNLLVLFSRQPYVVFFLAMVWLPGSERHFLSHALVVVAALLLAAVDRVASEQTACEKKILKDYPEADCSLEKDKEACRLERMSRVL